MNERYLYENKRSRYTMVCPFCKTLGKAYKGNNIICSCGAKYYWTGKVWLNRKTGEEVKESEDTE